jgi:hypothetical protein
VIRVLATHRAGENQLVGGTENHSTKHITRGAGSDVFASSCRVGDEIMATFPEEVLTRTKKGEVEVRSLIDRGRYVRYNYLDPETGEAMEGGKVKLVLTSDAGRTEEFFIIPTRSKRDLIIPAAEKGARKVWDGTRAVDL